MNHTILSANHTETDSYIALCFQTFPLSEVLNVMNCNIIKNNRREVDYENLLIFLQLILIIIIIDILKKQQNNIFISSGDTRVSKSLNFKVVFKSF